MPSHNLPDGAISPRDPEQARRVELVLQQLESLPTLPSVATRLLELTADESADVREVVRIIESDPSLTARVLSLCRRADRGVSDQIQTVDRAVVMLGFEAIRNLVLSVEIYNLFAPELGIEGVRTTGHEPLPGRFDRAAFWKHSIAVAVASQLFAEQRSMGVEPAQAFVCGLLHDLGKIALDRVLPKSYDRVVELADSQAGDIAEVERRVLGLDHHTAGKRLAEQWKLPHAIQDVLWLHGQAFESLPDLPHRRLIGVVSLADAVARRQHLGYSGNHTVPGQVGDLAAALGLPRECIDKAANLMPELVSSRAEALGLGRVPTRELFLESITQANRALGRINEALERRSRVAAQHERILRAIREFHEQTSPGESIAQVCGQVIASASQLFGRGFYAALAPLEHGKQWQIGQFAPDGRLMRSQIVDATPAAEQLASTTDEMQVSVALLGLLPWVTEFLGDASDVRNVRLLPLRCAWGLSGVLFHDHDLASAGFTRSQLLALCSTWAAAIAGAKQHSGAKRLGEQLAESNRVISDIQARLARTQVMASLGEMAAGAAHEMNNPLTVISGRSQVLASQLSDPAHRRMAEQIVEQAHRLSDLITCLHLFAEPPAPRPAQVDVETLVGRSIRVAKERAGSTFPVSMRVTDALEPAWIDGDQIAQALVELIVNALQSRPKQLVEVRIQIDDRDDRLVVTVSDDGCGMSERTLAHAFDPFFSDKPAGRQPGLGLARAQRYVSAHGGRIELSSTPGEGTSARLVLPRWRAAPPKGREHDTRAVAKDEQSRAA